MRTYSMYIYGIFSGRIPFYLLEDMGKQTGVATGRKFTHKKVPEHAMQVERQNIKASCTQDIMISKRTAGEMVIKHSLHYYAVLVPLKF